MELRTTTVTTLLVALVAVCLSHGQAAKENTSATAAQVAICAQANSALTKAECENLVLEFYKDKSAQNGFQGKNTFLNPIAALTPFVVGERQKAFQQVAGAKLNTVLSSTAQAALNTAAQILSTKAAVNQTGAFSGASGSTNLVSKPTTTDLISVAAESGAFTDTVNGNSLTAQANVDGLRRYLAGQPFADLSPSALDILSHLTLAATFTLAQSGSTGVSTSGSATPATPSIPSIVLPSNNVSFNSLSANCQFWKRYNPHSKKFMENWRDAWNAHLKDVGEKITAVEKAVVKISPFVTTAENDPDVVNARTAWINAAKDDETNNDFAGFVRDYTTFTTAFVTALEKADPNFSSDILSVNEALQDLATVNNAILDQARGKPLLTLSYTYSAPQTKPATHTATLAAAYVAKGWNGAQLTGNAAGSWFASLPTGATYGRVQSYQFSGEYDQPIGSKTAPRATFSLAGYGQYQYSPTVIKITSANLAPGTDITLTNGQVLVGTAGWLAAAQAKLTFNIGKGTSIPVAFKWSSKTDLLPGNDWKGQFGISYDLSALSAMLSGK